MSDFTLGTLYEVNQTAMDKESILTFEELHKRRNILGDNLEEWFINNSHNHYFMLLNNDERDYTLFNNTYGKGRRILDEIIECMQNRGNICSMENVGEDPTKIEIWIKKADSLPIVYYFFLYDEGVIEI